MESFTFILQKKQGQPLYLQLYHYIKQEINTGHLESGEKLPSKRSVSTALTISINTVESAYEQLEAEGYIEARARSGFYVAQLQAREGLSAELAVHEKKALQEAPQKPALSFDTTNVDTQCFPYATWQRLSKESMQKKELMQLGDSKGDASLRSLLCDFLHQTRGVNCTPAQIIVGAGSEYLMTILVELIGREQLYAMENPGYVKTRDILQNAGAKIVPISLDESGISVTDLVASQAQVVHITPSHQFPMGIIMPIGRRRQLLQWAEKETHYLIEDDYDSEFRYSGRPIPALQGLEKNEHVVYLTTFSKSVSPSFRLGVMVLPKELARRYEAQFSSFSSTVSRFEQHTLQTFIAQGHFGRHLNKLRKLYKQRKDCLEQALSTIDGATILGANAGLHLVVQIAGWQEVALVKQAESVGVAVTGLSRCYLDHAEQCPLGAVLLGYATLSEHKIVEAVALLKQAWS